MSNAVTSKEYWDHYWGAGRARYANYDISQGLFHSYHLLLSMCIRKTQARVGRRTLTFVDCGCGEGLFLRFVHEQFPSIQVSGIEYSDAIDKARVMAEALGYDFHLIQDDLFNVCRGGSAGPFDALISLGLIEHFEDPAAVLRQMEGLIAANGCLITIIPNFTGAFNFLWKSYDRSNYNHHVPISEAQLLRIHRDLGFEDVTLFNLGTPTIPGIHEANSSWQKMLNGLIVQINGRVLQRLWPRQKSLTHRHPMSPAMACVGWKPNRAHPDDPGRTG